MLLICLSKSPSVGFVASSPGSPFSIRACIIIHRPLNPCKVSVGAKVNELTYARKGESLETRLLDISCVASWGGWHTAIAQALPRCTTFDVKFYQRELHVHVHVHVRRGGLEGDVGRLGGIYRENWRGISGLQHKDISVRVCSYYVHCIHILRTCTCTYMFININKILSDYFQKLYFALQSIAAPPKAVHFPENDWLGMCCVSLTRF